MLGVDAGGTWAQMLTGAKMGQAELEGGWRWFVQTVQTGLLCFSSKARVTSSMNASGGLESEALLLV